MLLDGLQIFKEDTEPVHILLIVGRLEFMVDVLCHSLGKGLGAIEYASVLDVEVHVAGDHSNQHQKGEDAAFHVNKYYTLDMISKFLPIAYLFIIFQNIYKMSQDFEDPNFDAIAYLNKRFPDEDSLV